MLSPRSASPDRNIVTATAERAHLTCTPKAPPMSRATGPTPNRLRIWQQNLNKSRVVQEDLINSGVYKDYDVLILQEPYIDSYGNTKATSNWRVVYPTSFLSRTHPTRSVMLIAGQDCARH